MSAFVATIATLTAVTLTVIALFLRPAPVPVRAAANTRRR